MSEATERSGREPEAGRENALELRANQKAGHDPAPAYCGHCGEPLEAGDHTVCDLQLQMEPPRFCGHCRRRMKVQVTPRGWSATCVEHGELSG